MVEYRVVALAEMPAPAPFREPCMAPSWTGDCRCWYHAVDWELATAIVIEFLEEQGCVLDPAALTQDLPESGSTEVDWATWSLLNEPIVVSNPADGTERTYINGQHRVQAMIDQGVELVVVERNPPTDPRVLAQDP